VEPGEEGFDVARVGPPLEEITDCHFGSELFGVDESQVRLEVSLLLG
jgi:hypothetical protein